MRLDCFLLDIACLSGSVKRGMDLDPFHCKNRTWVLFRQSMRSTSHGARSTGDTKLGSLKPDENSVHLFSLTTAGRPEAWSGRPCMKDVDQLRAQSIRHTGGCRLDPFRSTGLAVNGVDRLRTRSTGTIGRTFLKGFVLPCVRWPSVALWLTPLDSFDYSGGCFEPTSFIITLVASSTNLVQSRTVWDNGIPSFISMHEEVPFGYRKP